MRFYLIWLSRASRVFNGIHGCNGLFRWDLWFDWISSMVLESQDPEGLVWSGAKATRASSQRFCIWSNDRCVYIWKHEHGVYWCIEKDCLRMILEQCEINVKHTSIWCAYYIVAFLPWHPSYQPHLTKVHHIGGHVIVPRREGSKPNLLTVDSTEFGLLWFIIYSYLFFSEWFPTEIFKIIIQPQSLQSLQEYSPHFGNLSGCEPQQVMATNITDCCPVFTGPSEVWSHHRCWLFTHCSGLKWPGAPGSLFWSRWKP